MNDFITQAEASIAIVGNPNEQLAILAQVAAEAMQVSLPIGRDLAYDFAVTRELMAELAEALATGDLDRARDLAHQISRAQKLAVELKRARAPENLIQVAQSAVRCAELILRVLT